jgi:hypothetical protein
MNFQDYILIPVPHLYDIRSPRGYSGTAGINNND